MMLTASPAVSKKLFATRCEHAPKFFVVVFAAFATSNNVTAYRA
jgi:hypothetical protein